MAASCACSSRRSAAAIQFPATRTKPTSCRKSSYPRNGMLPSEPGQTASTALSRQASPPADCAPSTPSTSSADPSPARSSRPPAPPASSVKTANSSDGVPRTATGVAPIGWGCGSETRGATVCAADQAARVWTGISSSSATMSRWPTPGISTR
jgi:hypothetical protein